MKAVLVICEGHHDVVFVQRSLGAVAGCRWMKDRIRELPSPFGTIPGISPKGLIAQRIERDVDDLTLRSAEYPPLPQFHPPVLDESADIIFLPVRANGKTQVAAVVELLKDIDLAMGVNGIVIAEYAVAFLFDADTVGLTATLKAFREDYSGHFGNLSSAGHAKWVATATCPVGVFVFHRTEADETGTLEDHLAPMAKSAWPDRYASACRFIDGNKKPGDHERAGPHGPRREGCRFIDGNKKPGDGVSRNDARRLKAIITSAGQFDHPGSPLSTMIARDGLPEGQFKTSPMSKALAAFLQGVPWRNDQSSTSAT